MTWAMTKTLVLVLSGLLFCACGDDDTTTDSGPATPDATEGMDAGPDEEDAGPDEEDAGPITVDAGPMDVGTDVPASPDAGPLCLFNSECPDEDACTGDGSGGASYCVPGERGSVAYGTACETSEECVSAVCLEGFCSMLCEAEDGCPSDNLPRCHPALGYCTPAAAD